MTLRILAPAKVNLHLAVGARQVDGYHAVETVLQALAFGDTVTIMHGPASFSCEPDLGLSPEHNLAWRAARAMAETFGRDLEVQIEVEKRVPHGAGLGGASSDAVAVIAGLATLWGIDLADTRVYDVARALGADAPFFLEGGAALYTGRGDVLARRLRPLDAHVVLVKPADPVPTAEAYAGFDRLPAASQTSAQPMIEALEAGDAALAATRLENTMTASSITLVPDIAQALALVHAGPGVLGSAMAGSGSAVFGICESARAAEECAVAARDAGFWARATKTHSGGCVIERG